MEDPCKNCHDRQWYARRLDIHFWGEDCPYVCEEYERYKEEKETDKQKAGEAKWLSNESLTEQQHGSFTENSTVKPVTANGEQEQ